MKWYIFCLTGGLLALSPVFASATEKKERKDSEKKRHKYTQKVSNNVPSQVKSVTKEISIGGGVTSIFVVVGDSFAIHPSAYDTLTVEADSSTIKNLSIKYMDNFYRSLTLGVGEQCGKPTLLKWDLYLSEFTRNSLTELTTGVPTEINVPIIARGNFTLLVKGDCNSFKAKNVVSAKDKLTISCEGSGGSYFRKLGAAYLQISHNGTGPIKIGGSDIRRAVFTMGSTGSVVAKNLIIQHLSLQAKKSESVGTVVCSAEAVTFLGYPEKLFTNTNPSPSGE